MLEQRPRPFPERGTGVPEAIVGFLQFLQTTAINKVAGLTEEQARATPVATSPAMSLLGVVKHLTAVQRQHVQIHIGGSDLPSLWRPDDPDFDFRLEPTDSIASVTTAFDEEWNRSQRTLAKTKLSAGIVTYGNPNTAGRLLVDVLQETARHVGHMDILRELVDGATGE
jgi:hypothetical protein